MATRSLENISVQIKVSAQVKNTLDDSSEVTVIHPSLNYRPTLTNGVGDNQANRGWQIKSRTLASGASEVLDLYDGGTWDAGAGGGKDGVGQAIAFEEIVGIIVVNENAVTAAGQLSVDPDPTQGFGGLGSHSAKIGAALAGQGVLAKFQLAEVGLDVVDGSNHRLRFTAIGGEVTYSVYILARHDDDESSSSSSSASSSQSSASLSSSSVSASSSSISTSSVSSSSSSSSSQSSASLSSSSSSSSVSSSSVSSPSSSSQSRSSLSSGSESSSSSCSSSAT